MFVYCVKSFLINSDRSVQKLYWVFQLYFSTVRQINPYFIFHFLPAYFLAAILLPSRTCKQKSHRSDCSKRSSRISHFLFVLFYKSVLKNSDRLVQNIIWNIKLPKFSWIYFQQKYLNISLYLLFLSVYYLMLALLTLLMLSTRSSIYTIVYVVADQIALV